MGETKKRNIKQTFMTGVLVIVISQILIKALGFIYKLVITNIPEFGDAGNGYYSAGYQIYMLLIAISSMGIPGAISKLVSERRAKGDFKGAHRIFRVAFGLFACIGALGSLMLFFGAKFIACTLIDNPGAEYVIVCLSPSIFFVCISAVIRGYFNGMQNMQATGRSQVFEQIFNCVLTITIVYMLIGTNTVIMAAGSSIATTLATMISFIYLTIFYKRRKEDIWEHIRANQTKDETKVDNRTVKNIVKGILALSIPISLGSIISAINRTVDATTVLRGIKASMGYTDEVANYWYGILAGKIDALTSFPLALNIAFAIALIPAISAAIAIGDTKSASKRVSFSMQLTMLIALPCTIGMVVLADPILHLLYPNAPEGAMLLQICAFTIIFTALSQTMNGALQGLGKVLVPAISLGCGCLVKLACNLILIYNPMFNIYGAAIGSVACHIVASVISFIILSRNIKLDIDITKFLVKPLIINAIMGVLAWGSFLWLNSILSISMATVGAIGVAVLSYVIMVIMFRVLNKEDYNMIPGGKAILVVLEKFKIY